MIDGSQLNIFQAALAGFVPTALAAVLLREKGPVGWLSIAGIVLVGLALVTGLEGNKLVAGFVGLLAGLQTGGKISDWRNLKRTQKEAEGERRQRDARFR